MRQGRGRGRITVRGMKSVVYLQITPHKRHNIFGDIVIKFERGFVQCFDCGSIVFLSTPGTATIICTHSKTKSKIKNFSVRNGGER